MYLSNSYLDLNYNLIKALDALLIEKNVSKAALRCDVGQSAMSVSLRKLRAHFNNELIVKGQNNQYELTPFAESLQPRVRGTLQELNDLFLVQPTFDPKKTEANISIGMSDYAGFVVLPRLISFLEKEAPKVQITQIALNDVDSMTQYHALNLDFAIGDFRNPPQELKTMSLFSDHGVIVGAKGHPLLSKKKFSLKEMVKYPQVFVALEKKRNENFILSMMESQGFDVDVRLITPHTLLALQVLPGTSLITNTVTRLALPFLNSLNLVQRETPYTIRSYDGKIYWSKQYDRTPLHQWLRQSLKKLLLDN